MKVRELGRKVTEGKLKARIVYRKVYDYIRYDLKEIVAPSSLPDPPHIRNRPKPPKLTWRQRLSILTTATRLYCASWVRNIGPDLRPEYYKKLNEANGDAKTPSSAQEQEPSVLEDLLMSARGGAETFKPALQRVYMARASVYRDALKSFIQGYQEGVQQVMEKQEESKTQSEGNAPKKSP